MTLLLVLLTLLVFLVSVLLLGAQLTMLIGPGGLGLAVAGVACFIVCFIVPLFFAAKAIKKFENKRRSSITLISIFLWNAAIAALLIFLLPGPSRRAIDQEGVWFIPGDRESIVHNGARSLASLLPGTSSTAVTSTSLDAGIADGGEEAADAGTPDAGLSLNARQLFQHRADTVVVIRVQSDVSGSSIMKKIMKEFGVKVMESIGSGFLVSADGLFVTNHHVIGNAHRAVVITRDKHRFENVEILVSDPTNDLVLAKINTSSAAFTKLTAKKPAVGEPAYAIGNPLGLEYTLTQGIVSAVRNLQGTSFLQMQTPVAPGSSGGPLFNEEGDVMGVNTAVRSPGLNLAVHVEHVEALLKAERTKKVLKPYVPGLQVATLTVEGASLTPVDRINLERLVHTFGTRIDKCVDKLPEKAALKLELAKGAVVSNLDQKAVKCLTDDFGKVAGKLLNRMIAENFETTGRATVRARFQGLDLEKNDAPADQRALDFVMLLGEEEMKDAGVDAGTSTTAQIKDATP